MSEEPWQMSKSVPITFILAIFMQTVVIIWFVATLRNDVDNNKRDIITIQSKVESISEVVVEQSILLARIDENLKVIRNALEKKK
jgi:hypothetical protein